MTTVATWPVVFGRALVSACLRTDTTDVPHIIEIAKLTWLEPEQTRSASTLNAARRSVCCAPTGAKRGVVSNENQWCRESGRLCGRFHRKVIPSAVSRMFYLALGDPRHRSCRDVVRVCGGPRRDLGAKHTAPFVAVIAQSRVKNCEASEISDLRTVSGRKLSELASPTTLCTVAHILGVTTAMVRSQEPSASILGAAS